MLVIAALGLLANGVAFRLLHSAGEHNINIKGAMLHVASDLLGSVAAVAAAIVIWLTGWTRIDPILSIFVAALIGRSAIKLIQETTHILLEGAPKHIDVDALTKDLVTVGAEVEDIHSVRIWQLTPDQPRLTLHAKIRDGAAANDALQLIKRRLAEKFGIRNSTIQIESGGVCPDHSHGQDDGASGDHQSTVDLHAFHRHAHSGATAASRPAAGLRAVVK
jgi:cobalt-zinc-cadmium efflux system protein